MKGGLRRSCLEANAHLSNYFRHPQRSKGRGFYESQSGYASSVEARGRGRRASSLKAKPFALIWSSRHATTKPDEGYFRGSCCRGVNVACLGLGGNVFTVTVKLRKSRNKVLLKVHSKLVKISF